MWRFSSIAFRQPRALLRAGQGVLSLERSPAWGRQRKVWGSAFVALLLAAGVQARAESWPMFRGGPALLGIASGRLPDKLKLLWSFKTGGPVKSSAAIGEKQWSFKTGSAVESSPLVLDGKVFFGSADSSLYALEAATGKQVWKYDTGDKI